MNGNCQTCPVESQCAYPYKPTDCCDQRKFRPMKAATTMPNSREQFEAKYGKRGDGSLSYAGWDFRWEAWQAGAAAEREACAKICESFGGELTKWPDAYEGATAETQFIRGIGDCISKPFAKAIRDRSAP